MPRRLGQHFLKNKKILEKIADSLNPKSGDIVVEIGPGHGELTEELLKYPVTVLAVERDEALVNFLNKNFKTQISNFKSNPKSRLPKLNILNGDALKILPSLIGRLEFDIGHSGYKVVGNIPYYITGYLLRILSGLEHKPEAITLLIQKEVAERIVAKPPKMNLLAAVTQSWSEPKIILSVGRKEFSPPPKVDSAVITMVPGGSPSTLGAREAQYYEFLRVLFRQPRKTIVNNLMTNDKLQMTKNDLIKELTKMNINPLDRPQDLSADDIAGIFKIIL